MVPGEHGDVERVAVREGFIQANTEVAFATQEENYEDSDVH